MRRGVITNQLLLLAHVIKNQTKASIVEKSSIMRRKIETSVHAITTNGFYLWLGIN
jgi:hypothetical protein